MSLQEFLVWVLSGGGAGVVAFILMEWIGKNTDLQSDLKRYLSLALAGLVAVAAYSAGVAMGYEPTPEDVRGWIEAVFSVIAVAVMASQAVHGFARLRVKRI